MVYDDEVFSAQFSRYLKALQGALIARRFANAGRASEWHRQEDRIQQRPRKAMAFYSLVFMGALSCGLQETIIET